MSGPGPFGSGGDEPVPGFGLFGDLARMLQGQGGFQWDQARAMALQLATGGTSEANVDPLERIKLEQLARVAELHVGQATGLSTSTTGRPVTVVPVTRAQWVQGSTDAYRPLFEKLAASLAAQAAAAASDPADPLDDGPSDPMGAFLEHLVGAAAPMLLSLMAGSLLGHLARRSFGQYDLPVPRPASDELVLVAPNLAEFGEAWSLQHDDLLLWVCIHEITHHAVLGLPHVRHALDELLAEYAAGFTTQGGGLDERLGELSLDDPSSLVELQQRFSDPEVLLGAIRSDAQRHLLPRLEALVAVIVGYVDWVMDTVGSSLIGGYAQLTEALRRRRVEADASDRFVEQLLGLQLTQGAYDRGTSFIAGVVERAGAEGLERLWAGADVLPTPAEVDAPGLWLARIDLPTD
ncbi:MAG: zinc-dependent metalloprotease [Acidimicrobiia bacterium]|nr:zinc-dependent metalloprotease [Acidimicrobiia bacterium]